MRLPILLVLFLPYNCCTLYFDVLQLIGRIVKKYADRSGGFKVKDTYKPCTKGFWLWGAPLKRTTDDGTKYNILFLDTEGINPRDELVRISFFVLDFAHNLSSVHKGSPV